MDVLHPPIPLIRFESRNSAGFTETFHLHIMWTIAEILIAIIAIGGILALYGNKLSNSAGNKAGEALRRLDEHYDSYIEKQKTLLLLENNGETHTVQLSNEELSQYVEEVFCILKPDIDALIGQINSTSLSDVKITANIRIFRNVAALAEGLFEKRRKMGIEAITDKDEEKIYSAVKDAILADIKERTLNWKIGNIS